MLIHAIMCAGIFLGSMGPFLHYYGAWFIMYELSTIFLNTIMNFKQMPTNSVSPTTELIVGALFAITFIGLRIVFGPYYSFVVWKLLLENSSKLSWLCIIQYLGGNIILNLLNFIWFAEIVRNIKEMFFPSNNYKKVK